MTIVHLITTFSRGGAEIAVLGLAAQQAKKNKVFAVPLKGTIELREASAKADVIINQQPWSKGKILQLLEIVRLLKKLTVNDVFHCHLPRAELIGFVALFVSRSKVRFVITRHNSEPFFPKGNWRLSRLLSKIVTRRANAVIAISNSVKTYLQSIDEISSRRTISVIYYGYAPHYSRPRQTFTISVKKEKSIRLGLIARLEPQKGIDIAIESSAILSANQLEHSIEILGDGSQKRNLLSYCSQLGVQDRVHFLGRQDDVFMFLSTLDIFLFPSRYEGFGLVLLEAIDQRIPVIATRIPSTLEVLGCEHPGLVEPNNAEELAAKIQSFANSREIRSKTIKLQTQRLKLFSVERYVEEHTALYRQILI